VIKIILEEKAEIISRLVQEWLKINSRSDAKPDDVMQFLKENGVYSMNRKSASHLRRDLRKLAERNLLYLVKGLAFEQKNKNKLWYFNKVD
jgi:hypothetical protein